MTDDKCEHTSCRVQISVIPMSFLRVRQLLVEDSVVVSEPFFVFVLDLLFPFINASMLVCYSAGGCPVVHPYKGLPTLVGSRRASKRFLSSGSFPPSSFAVVTCRLVNNSIKR